MSVEKLIEVLSSNRGRPLSKIYSPNHPDDLAEFKQAAIQHVKDYHNKMGSEAAEIIHRSVFNHPNPKAATKAHPLYRTMEKHLKLGS